MSGLRYFVARASWIAGGIIVREHEAKKLAKRRAACPHHQAEQRTTDLSQHDTFVTEFCVDCRQVLNYWRVPR